MKRQTSLTPRRARLLFLLALAGSLAGTLLGPRLVGAFRGAPEWLLPAILMGAVLLAMVAGYAALHMQLGPPTPGRER